MGKKVLTVTSKLLLRGFWERAAEGGQEIADPQLYTIKGLFVFFFLLLCLKVFFSYSININ